MTDLLTDILIHIIISLGLFVDFSKAFDRVHHLLNELSMYGISDNRLELIQSHLQDRTQRLFLTLGTATYTYVVRIGTGVPQDSSMGTFLLLLLYKGKTLDMTRLDAAEAYVFVSGWFPSQFSAVNSDKTDYECVIRDRRRQKFHVNNVDKGASTMLCQELS